MAKRTYYEMDGGLVIESENAECWRDAKRLSAAEGKRRMREQAREELRGLMPEGSTVWTCLRNVSASGMSRRLTVHVVEATGDVRGLVVRNVTTWAARVLEYPINKRGEMRVDGCGMDMGWHVVDGLAWALGEGKAQRTLRHEWL